MSPLNSRVESLSPRTSEVTAFGGEAFKEVIKVKRGRGRKVGCNPIAPAPLQRRKLGRTERRSDCVRSQGQSGTWEPGSEDA